MLSSSSGCWDAHIQANPAGDQDRFDKRVTRQVAHLSRQVAHLSRQVAHLFCETPHLGTPGTLDAREWSPGWQPG
jgi:hypothetical protein